MALTPAKLAANRRNARKSTGPRTAAGKARSRLNALKHGILASEAVIRAGEGAEEAVAFERLLEALREDLAPSGALEELLVEKLAVITWRWRRVLRFELGAIRERADEAVSAWRKAQWEAYCEKRRLWEAYGRSLGEPEPAEWRHTEDLAFEAELEEEYLAAVSGEDPMAKPSEALVHALARVAEQHKLPVKRLLGFKGRGEWWEFDPDDAWAQSPEGREGLRRLFEALCRTWEVEPPEAWERLRNHYAYRLESARKALERRRQEEERVRMLAAVPDEQALERVLRYEAHLAREFARTLDQLEKARGLSAGAGMERPSVAG